MDARAGTTMPSRGADLLIVTGADGIVEMTIDGHYVLIEENSYLHMRPDGRSFLGKFKERHFGRNTARMMIGQIWARTLSAIGCEETELHYEGNAVVGVRG